MINTLLNFTFQSALLLLGIWLTLALLGLKWRVFKSMRQVYSNLVKTVILAVAAWLWAPEMKREGGGQVAQAGSEYQEEESWEELEEEGLP
jgi:hypothetical protein